MPDSQVMSDLDAAVVYAESTGKADTSRLGVTGFCWGGRIAWTYCVHNPKVKAGVAWYGRLVAPGKAPLQPAYPVELAPHLKVPVLGLYGGADASISLENVEQMRAALKAAGNATSEIVVYDGAPHAFLRDTAPTTARKRRTTLEADAGVVQEYGVANAPRRPRGGGDPGQCVLDSRLRGNDAPAIAAGRGFEQFAIDSDAFRPEPAAPAPSFSFFTAPLAMRCDNPAAAAAEVARRRALLRQRT